MRFIWKLVAAATCVILVPAPAVWLLLMAGCVIYLARTS